MVGIDRAILPLNELAAKGNRLAQPIHAKNRKKLDGPTEKAQKGKESTWSETDRRILITRACVQ